MRRRWTMLPVLAMAVLLAWHGTVAHAEPGSIVEAVQRALVDRGFDPGEVDGAIGSRTRRALEAFQRSAGLPETGQADSATLEALGLKPAADAPKPEPPSVESGATPSPGTTSAGTSGDDPSGPDSAPDHATGTTAAGTTAAGTAATGTTAAGTAATGTTAAGTAATGTTAAGTTATGTTAAGTAATGTILGFADLGWHHPQTGAEALKRFRAIGAPSVFRRGSGSLFVPNPELVFVLAAGEEVPGFDCDPGSDRLTVEFAFGPDGPVIFTPVAGGQFCQMGIGIALEVGGTLEMRRIDWGDVQHPSGTARITREGLEFTR